MRLPNAGRVGLARVRSTSRRRRGGGGSRRERQRPSEGERKLPTRVTDHLVPESEGSAPKATNLGLRTLGGCPAPPLGCADRAMPGFRVEKRQVPPTSYTATCNEIITYNTTYLFSAKLTRQQ